MNNEIRDRLNNVCDLLKQLTEEVSELADCFYDDDEDEDEEEVDGKEG